MLINSSPEIAKEFIESSTRKVHLPIPKQFLLGIYGGFYISLGALCSLVCGYRFIGGDGRFYSGLVFPIGLMLCLFAGGEIFSAHCLLVIPFFCKRIDLVQLLLSCLLVFLGNFIGGLIMAFLVVYGHVPDLFELALASTLVNNGIQRCTLSFGDAFVKGILCNFCLCLAIWLSFSGKDLFSKMAALWAPTMLFIACGYEHCVESMFYIPAGLFASYEYDVPREKLNWGRYFYKNLIPVILGNIIGGAVLVGFGYWYIYLTPDSCCKNNNIKNGNNINNSYNINNINNINTNYNNYNINNENNIHNIQIDKNNQIPDSFKKIVNDENK